MSKRYTIKELVAKGLVPPSVVNDIEIKDKVSQLMRTGFSHGQAVRYIASEMSRTRQAIYKSLKRSNF